MLSLLWFPWTTSLVTLIISIAEIGNATSNFYNFTKHVWPPSVSIVSAIAILPSVFINLNLILNFYTISSSFTKMVGTRSQLENLSREELIEELITIDDIPSKLSDLGRFEVVSSDLAIARNCNRLLTERIVQLEKNTVTCAQYHRWKSVKNTVTSAQYNRQESVKNTVTSAQYHRQESVKNTITSAQYHRQESVEVNPVPPSINDEEIEVNICKALSSTRHEVKTNDLQACHRLKKL